ncbi:MAG: hypothetical protein OHK93_003541 [Ramalina farinacea]|uniref:Uncharacterized protein n=1 Tax=Ramalina farinacea TaxID=258253 RepID=A0AA43QTG8_9LECA|nr:hypothetical protein [Ramalina farinacea]
MRAAEPAVESQKGPLSLHTVHEPPDGAIADVVFIHGLGGGSRKTWAKNDDPELFWPGEWLPRDDDFQNVRILTFGYDADWGKKSILNVQDFGKSLLYALKDAPTGSRAQQCPIIFVCHSLGGLVAKKAFNMSKTLRSYEDISRRIRTIFFLGCPHRGSNLADLLSRILRVIPSVTPGPFLYDLLPDSTAIQAINEEFPQHCGEIDLHSFYETDQMSLGFKRSLIVPKDSAILNYTNERSTYLRGNHREICMFHSKEDANYKSIRNSLAAALLQFREPKQLLRTGSDFPEYQSVKESLNVDDIHDDICQSLDLERLPGSCDWIADMENYLEWLEGPVPSVYWITAKPGAGKSYLSSRIISDLKRQGKQCAYYFFGFGDKSRTGASKFLRVVACQLSRMHEEIAILVSKKCQRDSQLSKADHRTLWRKLFSEGILQTDLNDHYIIVDALDESMSDAELIPLLLRLSKTGRTRVLVTSRNKFESYRTASPSQVQIMTTEIPQEATRADIPLYVQAYRSSLPALGQDREQGRDLILESVLEKSDGCFLWVRLVMDELRRVHTAAEVQRVLREVPMDMDDLYIRILDKMESLQYGKEVAQAILVWVACAARPLTVEEMQEAVELDIEDDVDSIERAIASTCGQLVYIDPKGFLRMIHQTARDFLLRHRDDLEYTIERSQGNKQLALICLKYLASSGANGNHRRKSENNPMLKSSAFTDYACTCLYTHINMVSSKDDEILAALAEFLSSNSVLGWIEYMVKISEMNRLLQTGRSLKSFLQRRQKHGLVPLGRDIFLVNSWSADLVRVVTKFGRNLTAAPSSIYTHIPAFCPSDTPLKKQFGTPNRSFEVAGLTTESWDDCSSLLIYKNEYPAAVACGDEFFAIGLGSGVIKVHSTATCQELQTLDQEEAVKTLRFDDTCRILVCAGFRAIRIWSADSWLQMWKFDLEVPSVDFSLLDDSNGLILAILRNNKVVLWDLESGNNTVLGSWADSIGEQTTQDLPQPMAAAIGRAGTTLAIAYRGEDILLWDIEENRLLDKYGQNEGSRGPLAPRRRAVGFVRYLEFSESLESGLLAASYNDGEIVVFDTFSHEVSARTTANIHTLSSTADGQILACGNSAGIINLYEFGSLRLLYRISSEGYGIRGLAFSTDGNRLFDIRGSFCRVWDPPVLVSMKQDSDDLKSDTVSISTTPQNYDLGNTEQSKHITTLLVLRVFNKIICGRLDGSICPFDGRTGLPDDVLIKNANKIAIFSIKFDEQSLTLFCADTYSKITAFHLTLNGSALTSTQSMSQRVNGPITQLSIRPGSRHCLVSSKKIDTLYEVAQTNLEKKQILEWPDRRSYRWCTHPMDISQLLLIDSLTAHIFAWNDLSRLTTIDGIGITGSPLMGLSLQTILPLRLNNLLAATFNTPGSYTRKTRSHLFLFKAQHFNTDASSVAPVPSYEALTPHIETLLGIYKNRFIFLQEDGSVASVDPDSVNPTENIVTHFYLPPDWQSAVAASIGSEAMIEVHPSDGTIVLAIKDKVALIKRGLKIADTAGQGLLGPKGPERGPSLASFRRSNDASRTQRNVGLAFRSPSGSGSRGQHSRSKNGSDQTQSADD